VATACAGHSLLALLSNHPDVSARRFGLQLVLNHRKARVSGLVEITEMINKTVVPPHGAVNVVKGRPARLAFIGRTVPTPGRNGGRPQGIGQSAKPPHMVRIVRQRCRSDARPALSVTTRASQSRTGEDRDRQPAREFRRPSIRRLG